jgi:signal transduction histidine kinase
MMQQVLFNLILNALDATSAGGEITVTTQKAADRAEILVKDNGCGIKASDLGKVFDPFFTTKSHGTGLGLANTYKILESHDGTLTVKSTPGSGSTFTASLPAEKR